MVNRIIGMGNALTDILIGINEDNLLDSFGLPKGSMSLVDSGVQGDIGRSTAGLPRRLSLGGAAGNTIRALAKLGASAGFIGKVGNDPTGDFFKKALDDLGVKSVIHRSDSPSGQCVALVSADGERTMATCLGAALELSDKEIVPGIYDGFDCLYIEGYLVQNHDLIERAVKYAKEAGLKVALDLASFNVVENNLDFLRGLVADYVDILFANQQEAKVFTGESDPVKALEKMGRICELAVVKVGSGGAHIKYGDEVIHVGVLADVRTVDTTGAGDFYAAGFLYGLSQGLSLRHCGTIGAIAAGKVVEVAGTTFDDEVWGEIARMVEEVKASRYLL